MADLSDATSTTNTDCTPKQSFDQDVLEKDQFIDETLQSGKEHVEAVAKKGEQHRMADNVEKGGKENPKEDSEKGGKESATDDVEKGEKETGLEIEGDKYQKRGHAFIRRCICTFLFLGVSLPIIGVVLYFTVFKPIDPLVRHKGDSSSATKQEVGMRASKPDDSIERPPLEVENAMVCPENWSLYRGKCYLLHPGPKDYCIEAGGVPLLTNNLTNELRDFLMSNIRNLIDCCVHETSFLHDSLPNVDNIDAEVNRPIPLNLVPGSGETNDEDDIGDAPNDSNESPSFMEDKPPGSVAFPLFENAGTGETTTEYQTTLSPLIESTTFPNREHGFWLGGGRNHNHGSDGSHSDGDMGAVPEGYDHDAYIWDLIEGIDSDADFPNIEGDDEKMAIHDESTRDSNTFPVLPAVVEGTHPSSKFPTPLPPNGFNHESSPVISGSGKASGFITPGNNVDGIKSTPDQSVNWAMLCGKYEEILPSLRTKDCRSDTIQICEIDPRSRG